MECGDCTACCTLSVVEALNKKAGVECSFCTNNRCEIYGDHPQECKDFECAYLQGGNNIELRPDKCGIMFLKKNYRIFTAMLVPGIPISDKVKEQIAYFTKQGYSVVLLKLGEKPHIIPSRDHVISEIYTEYVNLLIHGNV